MMTEYPDHPTLAVNLAALAANYEALLAHAPGAVLGASVKADAYGLGVEPVARKLAAIGCGVFFVAYASEGVALRRTLGPGPDICVLNGPSPTTIAAFRDAALTPVLNTIEQLTLWRDTAAPCMIHVDTGMNRLGLAATDVQTVLQDPAPWQGLSVSHILSHYACASDPARPENQQQADRYAALFEALHSIWPRARTSLAASAGLYLEDRPADALIRPGVALYGAGPQDVPEPTLQTVCTLTAPVLQLRQISQGDSVGYTGSFTATRDSRIATIGIGYGDGYLRSAANRCHIILHGQSCPVVGNVSMDLITVDVTDLVEPVKTGDRAEIFGPQLPIEEVARDARTITYELLVGLGPRVVRTYTD